MECNHKPQGSPFLFASLYFGMKDGGKREYQCAKCGEKIRLVYKKKNSTLCSLFVCLGILPLLGCWKWLFAKHIRIPFTVTIPWAISSVVYLRFLTGLVTKYCNCYEKIEDNCHEKTEDQSIIK